jgi:hypothetical protein
MDEVEGGLGRFLAKADQDFEFLAKVRDRDRYLAREIPCKKRKGISCKSRSRFCWRLTVFSRFFFGRESSFFVSTPLTVEEGWNLYIYV